MRTEASGEAQESQSQSHDKTVHFPQGLPAFESVKDFVIISNEEEAPFLWLQAVKVPNLAFVTIDPFLIHDEYHPDVLDEDVQFLGLEDPDDAMVLCIVNLRNNAEGAVSANLVSPIIINWKNRRGKQVILRNHLEYSVKYVISE